MNKAIDYESTNIEQLEPKHDMPFSDVPIINDSVHILLVEDNQKDVRLIKDLLVMKQKHQWQLTHVQNLDGALKLIKQVDYDIVVLDLFLPDSNGIQTLKRFIIQNNSLPVIVMSDLRDEDLSKDAIREGAQDYLVKGQFISDFFIRAVQYAIERKKIEILRNELLGYVNHEVSSPLYVIKDSLSQISEGVLGQINKRQELFLDLTLSGIDRLMTITEDYLLCTSLELGKLTIRKRKISINGIVREIAETFRMSFRQKNLDLHLRLPFRDIWINADRERIGQVLTNLLNNALKYTEQGFVKIAVRKSGNNIRCVIRDSGLGIAKEEIPKLFKKYGQTESSYKNYKGNGLGLYICKTLIHLHGGRIQVKSRVNRGTKFIFTIPLK